jgi:hypothetical protein
MEVRSPAMEFESPASELRSLAKDVHEPVVKLLSTAMNVEEGGVG